MAALFTNWKTALAGVLTAFFGFVLLHPNYFYPWMVDLAGYAAIGGLAALGVTAKDYNTHSTAQQIGKATEDAAKTPNAG